MPTTIPYDPSLLLGGIVEQTRINHLKEIADAQKRIDAAQDKLNAYILQKRSLDMTIQEMLNMGVGEDVLQKLSEKIQDLDNTMTSAAIEYVNNVIKEQSQIATLRTTNPSTQINEEVESPIDFNKSSIKKMPLSSNSMKMDVQFFRFDSNNDNSSDQANAIAAYVAKQADEIFNASKASDRLGTSTHSVTSTQASINKYRGTLVITANCTHKMVDVFAPLIIDVDKGIQSWNALNATDKIDMTKPKTVLDIANLPNDGTTAKMYLLSGASYGSSFVGMVHMFNELENTSSQSIEALADSIRIKMEMGAFFAEESGELGVDGSFSDSLKNLLSTSKLLTHCSVITMGLIPS